MVQVITMRMGKRLILHARTDMVPLLGKSTHVNRRCVTTLAQRPQFVPYTPVLKKNGYDIRLIEPHPVARTTYQRRDEGFLVLGEYLAGTGNVAGQRCMETQPIVMTYYPDGTKTMHVYVVPNKDVESQNTDGSVEESLVSSDKKSSSATPLPISSEIDVDIFGGHLVASIRFEGNATQEACLSARNRLLDKIKNDGIQPIEEDVFYLAQYGPLHSLSARTNEVWQMIKL